MTEAQFDSDTMISRVFAGKYRIDAMIGTGAMGNVYRATQLSLDRTVAVKILHPHLMQDQTVVERFNKEARSAKELKQPNCVQIIDFGKDHDLCFIVMELLEGISLSKLLERDYPIDDFVITHIFKQICRVLDEAHSRHIIHRDIKPDNIMLIKQNNDQYYVKIVDFGIAKVLEGADPSIGKGFQTKAGFVCGTPEYMSPEQARGIPLDGRSDLYALGITLYETLTNTVPFDGQTPIIIALKQITKPVPSIEAQAPHANPLLIKLAYSLLEKNPEDRPADAMEVLSILDSIEKELSKSPQETRTEQFTVTSIQNAPQIAVDTTVFPVHETQLIIERIRADTKRPILKFIIGFSFVCIIILLAVMLISNNNEKQQMNSNNVLEATKSEHEPTASVFLRRDYDVAESRSRNDIELLFIEQITPRDAEISLSHERYPIITLAKESDEIVIQEVSSENNDLTTEQITKQVVVASSKFQWEKVLQLIKKRYGSSPPPNLLKQKIIALIKLGKKLEGCNLAWRYMRLRKNSHESLQLVKTYCEN